MIKNPRFQNAKFYQVMKVPRCLKIVLKQLVSRLVDRIYSASNPHYFQASDIESQPGFHGFISRSAGLVCNVANLVFTISSFGNNRKKMVKTSTKWMVTKVSWRKTWFKMWRFHFPDTASCSWPSQVITVFAVLNEARQVLLNRTLVSFCNSRQWVLKNWPEKFGRGLKFGYVLVCRFGYHYLFLYVDLDGMSYMFMAQICSSICRISALESNLVRLVSAGTK